jgi:hypothetical protein
MKKAQGFFRWAKKSALPVPTILSHNSQKQK